MICTNYLIHRQYSILLLQTERCSTVCPIKSATPCPCRVQYIKPAVQIIVNIIIILYRNRWMIEQVRSLVFGVIIQFLLVARSARPPISLAALIVVPDPLSSNLPVARVECRLSVRAILLSQNWTDGVQDVFGGYMKARCHLNFARIITATLS